MSAWSSPPNDEGKYLDNRQPGLEHYNDQDTNKIAYGGPDYPRRNPYGERSRSRNPFGLSPLVFGVLIAALTTIVVGAALGGGLGGTLASCQSQNALLSEEASNSGGGHPANTPTPDSTSAGNSTSTATASSSGSAPSTIESSTSSGSLLSNYSAANPTDVNSLFLNCPAIDGQGISTFAPPGFRQNWTYHCGVSYQSGLAANGGGTIRDIAIIVAYSVDDCVQNCFGMNVASINAAFIQKCSSVFFETPLSESVTKGTGNCYLKNATLDANTNPITDTLGVSVSLDAGF